MRGSLHILPEEEATVQPLIESSTAYNIFPELVQGRPAGGTALLKGLIHWAPRADLGARGSRLSIHVFNHALRFFFSRISQPREHPTLQTGFLQVLRRAPRFLMAETRVSLARLLNNLYRRISRGMPGALSILHHSGNDAGPRVRAVVNAVTVFKPKSVFGVEVGV
jgi:hypothetical protein